MILTCGDAPFHLYFKACRLNPSWAGDNPNPVKHSLIFLVSVVQYNVLDVKTQTDILYFQTFASNSFLEGLWSRGKCEWQSVRWWNKGQKVWLEEYFCKNFYGVLMEASLLYSRTKSFKLTIHHHLWTHHMLYSMSSSFAYPIVLLKCAE